MQASLDERIPGIAFVYVETNGCVVGQTSDLATPSPAVVFVLTKTEKRLRHTGGLEHLRTGLGSL